MSAAACDTLRVSYLRREAMQLALPLKAAVALGCIVTSVLIGCTASLHAKVSWPPGLTATHAPVHFLFTQITWCAMDAGSKLAAGRWAHTCMVSTAFQGVSCCPPCDYSFCLLMVPDSDTYMQTTV